MSTSSIRSSASVQFSEQPRDPRESKNNDSHSRLARLCRPTASSRAKGAPLRGRASTVGKGANKTKRARSTHPSGKSQVSRVNSVGTQRLGGTLPRGRRKPKKRGPLSHGSFTPPSLPGGGGRSKRGGERQPLSVATFTPPQAQGTHERAPSEVSVETSSPSLKAQSVPTSPPSLARTHAPGESPLLPAASEPESIQDASQRVTASSATRRRSVRHALSLPGTPAPQSPRSRTPPEDYFAAAVEQLRSEGMDEQAIEEFQKAIAEARGDAVLVEDDANPHAPCSLPVEVEYQRPRVVETCITVQTLNRQASGTGTAKAEKRLFPCGEMQIPIEALRATPEDIFGMDFPPEIVELDLSRSDVSYDQLLALTQRLPQLRKVMLFHCQNLTDLICLNTLTELEVLSCHSCESLTEESIFSLLHSGKLANLQLADWSNTQFSDRCAAECSKYPELRELCLNLCVGITDASVPHFLECNALGRLQIGGTEISLQGMQPLQSKDGLDVIYSVGELELPEADDWEKERAEKESAEKQAVEETQEERLPMLTIRLEQRLVFAQIFIANVDGLKDPEGALSDREVVVNQYYQDCFFSRGIDFGKDVTKQDWLAADKAIQAYESKVNIEKILPRINWHGIGISEPPKTPQEFMSWILLYPHSLRKITKLDLSNAQLTYLPQIFVAQVFTSLTEIDLSGNSIRVLPPQFFSKAPLLEKVVLQGNDLHVLAEDFLQFWPSLKHLDLRENNLKWFGRHFFQVCMNLEEVYLKGNVIDPEISFSQEDWSILTDAARIRSVDIRDQSS